MPLRGFLSLLGVLLLPMGAVANSSPGADALWRHVADAAAALQALRESTPIWPEAGTCEGDDPDVLAARALRARADALRAAPGVQLEAGYGEGLDMPGEEPDTYAGFRWNLLDGGLRENRRRAALLEDRARLQALEGARRQALRGERCRIDRLVHSLTAVERRLLSVQIAFLEDLLAARRRAYLQGVDFLDSVLETEAELRLARQVRDALPALDAPAAAWARPYRIPLDTLIERIRNDPDSVEQHRLRLALMRQEARLAEEDQRRLGVFLHYEQGNEGEDDEGFRGGIRYSQPLFEDPVAGLEHGLAAERRSLVVSTEQRVRRTRLVYAEYNERLQRVVRQHYRYLLAVERLRRSVAAHRLQPEDADLGMAVDRLEAALIAARERATALQGLYYDLGRVFEAAELPLDPALLQAVDLPDLDYRARSGRRALYVWSETLQRLGAARLVELARARGVHRLLVSTGPGTADDRLEALAETAAATGIDVVRLLGANRWVLPGGIDRALARIEALPRTEDGLHLNVEPQALDAYDDRPEALLDRYLALLEAVRDRLGPDVPLGVSVPAHWPVEVYARIHPLVDRLTVMAYGSRRADTLIRRLRPILETVPADKLVLALRASDFASTWQLEETFGDVRAATGIDALAIHDAAGLLELARGELRENP